MEADQQRIKPKFQIARTRLLSILNEKPTSMNSDSFSELLLAVTRRIKNREILDSTYQKLSMDLSIELAKETIRTQHEIEFMKQFKRIKRIRMNEQVWIGNYCVDYFSSSIGLRRSSCLRGFSHKGVAVEVDGKSHENPVKQKKDARRDEFLLSLGILPWRIKNDEVNCLAIKSFVSKLSPITSNDRYRLTERTELATCAYNSSDEQWVFLANNLFSAKGESHDNN